MLRFSCLLLAFSLFAFPAFLEPGPAWCAAKAAKGAKQAPAPGKPAATAGQEVKTEYFSVKIPPGWIMPYPVHHREGARSAVFHDEKSRVTVTVNALEAPFTLKEFTNNILESMRQGRLKTGMPVEEKGLRKIPIQGMPQGQAWLGANGKLCVAVVILSESANISSANELLAALRSPEPRLFPKQIK